MKVSAGFIYLFFYLIWLKNGDEILSDILFSVAFVICYNKYKLFDIGNIYISTDM